MRFRVLSFLWLLLGLSISQEFERDFLLRRVKTHPTAPSFQASIPQLEQLPGRFMTSTAGLHPYKEFLMEMTNRGFPAQKLIEIALANAENRLEVKENLKCIKDFIIQIRGALKLERDEIMKLITYASDTAPVSIEFRRNLKAIIIFLTELKDLHIPSNLLIQCVESAYLNSSKASKEFRKNLAHLQKIIIMGLKGEILIDGRLNRIGKKVAELSPGSRPDIKDFLATALPVINEVSFQDASEFRANTLAIAMCLVDLLLAGLPGSKLLKPMLDFTLRCLVYYYKGFRSQFTSVWTSFVSIGLDTYPLISEKILEQLISISENNIAEFMRNSRAVNILKQTLVKYNLNVQKLLPLLLDLTIPIASGIAVQFRKNISPKEGLVMFIDELAKMGLGNEGIEVILVEKVPHLVKQASSTDIAETMRSSHFRVLLLNLLEELRATSNITTQRERN